MLFMLLVYFREEMKFDAVEFYFCEVLNNFDDVIKD